MFSIPDGAICVLGISTVWQNWFLHVVVDGPVTVSGFIPKGLKPATSPANRFGERNCIHSNIDLSSSIGKLTNTRVPYSNFPDYAETLWDWGPNSTPFWEHFDYFIGMGENFSKTWANAYDSLIHYGEWDGNVLYCSSFDGLTTDASYQYYGAIRMIVVDGKWYGDYALNGFKVAPSDPNWIRGGPTSARAIPWVATFAEPPQGWRLRKSWRLISGTKDQSCDQRAFTKALENASTWSKLAVKTADLPDWKGSLSQAAAEQAQALNTNMFTLIPELIHLRTGVSSLLNQMKTSWKKKSIRSIADLELSLRYGVQLTFSDVISQAKRITQSQTELKGDCRARSKLSTSGRTSVQGTSVDYNIDYHLKVWYDPTPDDPVHRAVWSLLSYKLLPTLKDSWDVIPYSFVIDWLLNLDDTLAQVDANTLISALQVDSALFSRKASFALPARVVPDLRDLVQGVIHFSDYTRVDNGGLVPPTPSFAGYQHFNNFVEAAAILIQKTRH